MKARTDLGDFTWVRLSFVDVFGTSNSVRIPAGRFEDVVASGVPFDGSALEGRARQLESDMLLRPDPSTLVDLGGRLARAVCTVHTPDGARWNGDPRSALEAISLDAPEVATGATVAAELEFYLLDPAGEPLDRAGYFDEAESQATALVAAAAERLLTCGIPVDAWHHEAGPGQYEVDIGALPPVELADAVVLTKQILREQAHAHDAQATFMPRPFADQPGSGLHLHQRLATSLIDGSGELEPLARAFVAGQLAHAPALCALAAPTVNSYKRLHAGPEAPSAVVWAHRNRAALVRVNSYAGAVASIEYRGADPSANLYLLLTGLLAAALDGLDRDLELPSPAEETSGGYDPAIAEQRLEPLPWTLDDALDALVADDVVVDAFDSQALGRLVDGRRAEAQSYRQLVTEWECERYLDDA